MAIHIRSCVWRPTGFAAAMCFAAASAGGLPITLRSLNPNIELERVAAVRSGSGLFPRTPWASIVCIPVARKRQRRSKLGLASADATAFLSPALAGASHGGMPPPRFLVRRAVVGSNRLSLVSERRFPHGGFGAHFSERRSRQLGSKPIPAAPNPQPRPGQQVRGLPGGWLLPEARFKDFQQPPATLPRCEKPACRTFVKPSYVFVRKARWGREGKGKSGGVRIIYYYWLRDGEVYMLSIYAKNEQADMDAADKKAARKFVETLRNAKGKN